MHSIPDHVTAVGREIQTWVKLFHGLHFSPLQRLEGRNGLGSPEDTFGHFLERVLPGLISERQQWS